MYIISHWWTLCDTEFGHTGLFHIVSSMRYRLKNRQKFIHIDRSCQCEYVILHYMYWLLPWTTAIQCHLYCCQNSLNIQESWIIINLSVNYKLPSTIENPLPDEIRWELDTVLIPRNFWINFILQKKLSSPDIFTISI